MVDRLSKTTQNALINIVTIFLGIGVGSRLSAENFLNLETLGILLLGGHCIQYRHCLRDFDGQVDEPVFENKKLTH